MAWNPGLHFATQSAYTNTVSKLYRLILIFLAIILVVFSAFMIFSLRSPGVSLFPLRLPVNNTLIFIHAAAFSALSLILILLLLVSIRRFGREERRHKSLSGLYDSVFSQMTTGLLVINEKGLIKYLNPACARILERENRDLLVNRSYEILLDPVLLQVKDRLERSMACYEEFSTEYRVYLSSGLLSVRVSLTHFSDANLGRVSVIALEDKTAEAEAKRKLSQQLEETRRYAMSKDNFFSNMSHEIRTPINAILGMTYFLKKSVKGDKSLEYVQKIENASDILLGVVNDILDFSKMREHKFSLKSETFELMEIRKILLDLFAFKAEEKGLKLTLSFLCEDGYEVLADQFRLTQVYMNLIGNAIKFTDSGSVTVEVKPERDGEKIILRSSVTDTGCGLSEESISKLFTDFEQFGEVLLKRHEGTGLGLAISKRLVELMNGVIWVDSAPAEGSTFHFVVVLDPPAPRTALRANFPAALIRKRTGHILLVEDNEINAEIASEFLREMEYTVERSNDGAEAVARSRTVPPDYFDAVLMDIHMPRMNGYDAARILRDEIGLTCPIIAVSATTEEENRTAADAGLFAGYILKPYSQKMFQALFGEDFPRLARE